MRGRKYWVLLLVIVSILSACNSSDGASSSEGKTEIDFFHRWPNEPRKSFYDQKIEEFMEQNPDVHINVDYVLNDSYKEKIKVLVSNDNLPDIFSSWSDSFAKNLVSSGKILPVDDILKEDTEWSSKIVESQFKGFTFDDATYGVPFTVDGKAFFYNKKVFEEHGIEIPKTYDEFIAVLDDLQKAGYEQPLVEGLTNTWAISHYLGTIFQRLVDPEVLATDYSLENAEFTDEGYIKGLEVFQELTTYMGDVSTAIDHEAARNMFGSGEVPILYMQFAEIKLVEEIGDVEFGFFDFPSFEDGKGDQTALTGAPEGWMLSKNAPEEAVEFLKFLTSNETAFSFTETDGQLNAIEGSVTAENANETSLEAYDLVLNATSVSPWFDNALDINVADVFMRGSQGLATGQSTPADILSEVQQTVEGMK
ncbi:ABC transporter substrate-binding protein [Cytobacillus gottheilii]|uniref:Extracellular solute-binding protein n=1 Tax=Cytobacillus gottheilii TaxID=859144 RepID=A0ABX8FA10_9BACI|nr:extracellular solute-binding protein [Cytobacillus gottheilii]QVY61243.1 extracellular solute-binding protein [Cytobacillus gottheilii]